MATVRWTPAQQNCIDARGGTVLVSAAAGSGKTAVLIARIVSLLTDTEHPLDIDKLLVVTFTKAAAAEMRSRLGERIADMLAKNPRDRHLLRQQMLLPTASICTIDSFCGQLLREQAQRAGVSPRFRVADQTTLKIMKHDIATEIVEQAYKENDSAFMALCHILADDRSDGQLIDQILHIYDFIQAHPFPLQWLTQQEARFDNVTAVSDTIWGQILLEQIGENLTAAHDALLRATNEIANDTLIQNAYGPSLSISLSRVVSALHTLENGNWSDALHAVNAIDFPVFGRLTKYDDTAFKEYITSLRNHAKKAVAKAEKALAAISEEDALRDIAAAAPLVRALFDLVRRFDNAFSTAKAEQNLLDFNDMEHKALSLLATPQEDGTFTRTEAAREIGARFAYIMVDEYQDTNATQDTLFAALSDNEENLFFVGDIKQSIYGFRQAMPAIFGGRRRRSAPYNGVDFPASITLGNNFRSRKQVTDSVNFVFSRLMGEKTGGIVYDESEQLVSSATFPSPDSEDYNTELLIIEKKELSEPLSAHQAEARLIGQRILNMIAEGFQVSDHGKLRAAAYRDFSILLRSTKNTAPIFVRELQAMGIPVSSGNHDNFFDCAEIRTVVSILRTIDNPLLDIPLLATLMSPLFGFSPDDLSLIRKVDKDLPLFTALRRVALREHPLRERVKAFLETLDNYRMLSAALPADRLIRRLYEDTDMLSVMSAKTGGSQRIANLRHFYDLARHYEQQDLRGLAAFVRYLDKLEAQGIALDAASKDSDSQNAVHLMTIHHSKGLEFPVVFLAGLGSDFNKMSTRGDVLLHADHGIGITLRDRERMTQSDPIHRQAIATAIRRSERTEELRVLYVAMTRPKDKLIMVATVDRLSSVTENLRINTGGNPSTLTPAFIMQAPRMSDWLLACAMHHPAGTILRGGEAEERGIDGFCVKVVAPEEVTADVSLPDDEGQEIALPGIDERLCYTYPYAALGQIPAKITASQSAHSKAGDVIVAPTLTQPAFLSRHGLTPAQRGTATHIFLEHVNLGGSSAVAQATAMVDAGLLTAPQAQALNTARLQRFMDSTLASRMSVSDHLYREFAFALERPIATLGASMDHLPADAAKETVLVQGIADAVFEEDGALVIVDYKTDRVENGAILAQRYASQLAIYRDALARTLGKPVKECVIYSFHLGEIVPVP